MLSAFWLGNVLRTTAACTFWSFNFSKCSDAEVLCPVWLGLLLCATRTRTFSSSQLPKVVHERCALYFLAWTCASRRNGVKLFISHLTTWLRPRCFNEPGVRPSRATNHSRNTVFPDFATFSRTCIFFPLSSLLWLFPSLLFHASTLSEVWLLKLPSTLDLLAFLKGEVHSDMLRFTRKNIAISRGLERGNAVYNVYGPVCHTYETCQSKKQQDILDHDMTGFPVRNHFVRDILGLPAGNQFKTFRLPFREPNFWTFEASIQI